MKILLIAPGDSIHTARWIQRIMDRGLDVIFYDMTPQSSMQKIAASKIYRLEHEDKRGYFANTILEPLTVFLNLFIVWKHFALLRRVIKQESPSLIHLHWLYHPIAIAVGFIKAIPVLSTPWGSDLLTPEYKANPRKFKNFIHRISIRFVLHNSTAFCCDAQHMKRMLINFGANESKIRVIYFGTDIRKFSPDNRQSSVWSKYGLNDKNIKVLSNRVLADMYDIETFIKATREVHLRIENIDFIIAGGGPRLTHLKNYAIVNGTTRGITFTGRLEDEDFARLTCSSDIYVSTSPTDGGLSASVAEAMSAAVPVIITHFGDNSFWLKNESAGFLFNPGDALGLAERILHLSGDFDARKRMGLIGRDIIKVENNSEIETEKVISLYKSLS